jgi:hypothetical protein
MLLIRIATSTMVKPAGKTGGQWHLRVNVPGTNALVHEYTGAVAECPWPTELPVGNYLLAGERLDTDGLRLGNQVEGSYNWTGEGAEMVDVAAGISVVNV